jgi:hypothetical protein
MILYILYFNFFKNKPDGFSCETKEVKGNSKFSFHGPKMARPKKTTSGVQIFFKISGPLIANFSCLLF